MKKDRHNHEDRLDRILEQTLRDLPDRQAPESLLGDVMARVASEAERHRQSWFVRLQWPVVAVGACALFLAAYFGNDLIAAAAGYLSAGHYAGEFQTVQMGIEILGTLGGALRKVASLVPAYVWYGLLALIVTVSTFSCAGIGTLLFRLTQSGTPVTPSHSHSL